MKPLLPAILLLALLALFPACTTSPRPHAREGLVTMKGKPVTLEGRGPRPRRRR
jgi:hypothetical protein